MSMKELQLFRDILNCFPITGISLTKLSKEMNMSTSRLYNYKNGLMPKVDTYKEIMMFLLNNHREELSKILCYLNTDTLSNKEIEQQIKLYLVR